MKKLNGAKVYGDEKTNLRLTALAQSVFSQTDPCDIYEFEEQVNPDDDSAYPEMKYTYSIRSCVLDRDDMTEDDVNEFFESLAEEENDSEE